MKSYKEMTADELKQERELLIKRYEEYKAMSLSLNMTRGVPSTQQLDLASDMYDDLSESGFMSVNNQDVRNYGVPAGIDDVRKVFAEVLETDIDNIFMGNSSSLNQMFDALMRSMVFGEIESAKPWYEVEGRKWLCPAPGYDRHFRVTETLGFELISVPMTENGPDMDVVEELVKDPKVLGIWCVPCYSNPDGIVYSEETCRRLASMKTAAPDFRIMWDNAYCVHHITADDSQRGHIPDILSLCAEAGNPNRPYEFASSSKVTFAGGGISCFATNPDNMARAKKYLGVQAICTNKVNQLAHARFLPDAAAVDKHMRKHAEILRPKFEAVQKVLKEELGDCGLWHWTDPKGGYFVSFYAFPGTATKVVSMCKEAGVALTPAGASFPYGKDPDDSNIRLCPSFPPVENIVKAVSILSVCAKITAIDKLLEG
ncbi:MAG: aminotransferase class I/II-fold pyridoxal phosphate-dependent enzyme [Ruminococcaceae bacterium]|nr:aminotransferase class I/II-fold pyridoxal phosphate-dependent enzyme [Oscillospiraceae bacterium]